MIQVQQWRKKMHLEHRISSAAVAVLFIRALEKRVVPQDCWGGVPQAFLHKWKRVTACTALRKEVVLNIFLVNMFRSHVDCAITHSG